MAITAILSLLLALAIGPANAALIGGSTFRDGNTLFAANRNGEIVPHTIANMTTEFKVPGTADKVTVPGTIEQVMAFINAKYPDYNWTGDEDSIEDSNAAKSKLSTKDNTVYCDIGKQGSYYTAVMVKKFLRRFGRRKISVDAGPGRCYRASCHDVSDKAVGFYFCNDDTQRVNPTYNDVADLAEIVMDKCVEFGTPLSWVRGQAFHATLPWNVIITAEDSCQYST